MLIAVSLSSTNRLPGQIDRMTVGKVVSEVVIRTIAGEITSIISTRSLKRMKLAKEDKVFAIIKATEVSVQKEKK